MVARIVADLRNRALRVLKYLNSLHALCITVTGAAPAADHVEKQGHTTMTNSQWFLEHQHGSVAVSPPSVSHMDTRISNTKTADLFFSS